MPGRLVLLEEIVIVLIVRGEAIVQGPVVIMGATVKAQAVNVEAHALVWDVITVVIVLVPSATMVVGADHWDVLPGIVLAQTARPLAMMMTKVAMMIMAVTAVSYLPLL